MDLPDNIDTEEKRRVLGHLVQLALDNFSTGSRDLDHDRFCWFMERAVNYGTPRPRR